MKKFLVSSVALSVVFLGLTSVAFADTKCGNPSLSDGTTTYIACGNGMPIPNPGPVIKSGQSVTDEGGITSTCELFNGCVDMTHTDVYRNQMRAIVAQLTANGFLSQFPFIKEWIGK